MYRLTHDPVAVADYAVVGTGSAGSVLAERLSAEPRNQVVVLEAGGTDNDRRIHMPVTWMQLFRSAIDWDYLTEPQLGLNGRPTYWPRGKTLGGSSSMNAMMWVPGFAADYDEWAQHTGEQWSFNRIVKYFKQIENVEGARQHDEGVGGPLHINLSSIGGFAGSAGWGIYNSTKFAVEGFSEALAKEVAPLGIFVTVVEPGYFRTDFLDGSSLHTEATVIADYAETSGAMRLKAGELNHEQPGDPVRAVEAIMTIAESVEPPLRIQLGSDAFASVADKLAAVGAEQRRWRDLAVSTDFADT